MLASEQWNTFICMLSSATPGEKLILRCSRAPQARAKKILRLKHGAELKIPKYAPSSAHISSSTALLHFSASPWKIFFLAWIFQLHFSFTLKFVVLKNLCFTTTSKSFSENRPFFLLHFQLHFCTPSSLTTWVCCLLIKTRPVIFYPDTISNQQCFGRAHAPCAGNVSFACSVSHENDLLDYKSSNWNVACVRDGHCGRNHLHTFFLLLHKFITQLLNVPFVHALRQPASRNTFLVHREVVYTLCCWYELLLSVLIPTWETATSRKYHVPP